MMSTVFQSKSHVLSRVSSILDELQSLLPTLYAIRDDTSSSNASVASYKSEDTLWWDDSCLTTAYNGGDGSCSDDSLYNSSNESVSTDDEVLLSLTFTDLSPCLSSDVDLHHDNFVTMMSAAIRTIAPEFRYSSVKARRKRRKAKLKRVHPELRQMWVNAATIVSPVPKVPPSPSPLLPTVDWSQVNKRFLTNIPTPSHHPIHGCSQDEDLYKGSVTSHGQVISPRFERPSPFGTLLGYKTTEGVINFNEDQCFHGYAYIEEEGWMLKASYVKAKPKLKKWRESKRHKPRKS